MAPKDLGRFATTDTDKTAFKLGWMASTPAGGLIVACAKADDNWLEIEVVSLLWLANSTEKSVLTLDLRKQNNMKSKNYERLHFLAK